MVIVSDEEFRNPDASTTQGRAPMELVLGQPSPALVSQGGQDQLAVAEAPEGQAVPNLVLTHRDGETGVTWVEERPAEARVMDRSDGITRATRACFQMSRRLWFKLLYIVMSSILVYWAASEIFSNPPFKKEEEEEPCMGDPYECPEVVEEDDEDPRIGFEMFGDMISFYFVIHLGIIYGALHWQQLARQQMALGSKNWALLTFIKTRNGEFILTLLLFVYAVGASLGFGENAHLFFGIQSVRVILVIGELRNIRRFYAARKSGIPDDEAADQYQPEADRDRDRDPDLESYVIGSSAPSGPGQDPEQERAERQNP